uniref:Uncharacterized protein n=1 Tax=Rhizophora mucronata TaxID=61149 RepID=A0A2P2L168_RHIMU
MKVKLIHVKTCSTQEGTKRGRHRITKLLFSCFLTRLMYPKLQSRKRLSLVPEGRCLREGLSSTLYIEGKK